MARNSRGHCRISARRLRWTPYPIPLKRYASERRDWKEAKCSVCLEPPHNAILLLCSSHNKGCRPYMCGTSFRYSNCLKLYKKAYTRQVASSPPCPHEYVPRLGQAVCKKSEVVELCCPLCRGQVKGWTVVEPAREYLNKKKRGCMQDGCSFEGTYKRLRKHVRAEHRHAKPREVDPVLREKWKALELEREQEDVISTIMSSMPGAVVMGDYVIDYDSSDIDTDGDEYSDDGFYYDDDDGDDNDDDSDDDDYEGFVGRRDNRRLLYYLLGQGTRMVMLPRSSAEADREEGGGGGAADANESEVLEDYRGGGRQGRVVDLVAAGRGRDMQETARGGRERRPAVRGRQDRPPAIRGRVRRI